MNEILNCKGLRCPKPVLKVAIKANSIAPGTTLEVHAVCPSFPVDIIKIQGRYLSAVWTMAVFLLQQYSFRLYCFYF